MDNIFFRKNFKMFVLYRRLMTLASGFVKIFLNSFDFKKFIEKKYEHLNALDEHSRQFFKYSRPILEANIAREQPIRSIVLL